MSQPGHDASKVRASGPGLDTKGVSASLPVEFTIDARDAGEGLLTVQILVRTETIHSIYFHKKCAKSNSCRWLKYKNRDLFVLVNYCQKNFKVTAFA